MSTEHTRFGIQVHAILQHFETASLKLRNDGFSQQTSDRVGLFTTLCAHGWTIQDAWAVVNEQFPPEPIPTDATRPDGAGICLQDPRETPQDQTRTRTDV